MSVHPERVASIELVLDADRRLVIRKRATDPAAQSRLRHEHAVVDRFQHPGAVAVVSFTDDSESTVLTLRWAGPRTLSDIATPTVEEAAGLITTLATTVADAHDSGIVHGRLDPSHVIIDESGRPVICGWGGATFIVPGAQASGAAAQLADDVAASGAQANDAAARPADDVAALGKLLTGLVGTAGDLEPIPERRPLFRRQQRWSGYQRRALLTLADQAIAADAQVRPTARRLAATVMETIPGACPMAPGTEHAATVGHNDDDAAPRDEQFPARSLDPAPPATIAVPSEQAGASHDPRSEPSRNRDPRPTDTNDSETIEPQRSPSAGVIGSRSEPHPDRGSTPSPHAVRQARVRLSERRRVRTAGQRRRWMPVAAVSLVAVVTAVVVATFLRSRPSTTRSSPKHSADAARPVSRDTSRAALRESPSPTTDPSPAGRAALSPSNAGRPSEATSTTASLPPNCHPPAGTVADVDGDGCPEPVRIAGNVLITPSRQLAAGQRGDQVALGDWWCRDQVTPAVLRPTTGEVFVFARWPQPGADITITPTTVVVGATGIEVDHHESCDLVRVQRAGRGPFDISVPNEGPR